MGPMERAPAAIPSIADRVHLGEIRYANCWEDASLLALGLFPLAGARCLSIASAGDNTLSLLAREPAEVVAVDVSAAQIALLELKAAAFRDLDHEELLAFLGVRSEGPTSRLATWARLGPTLSAAAQQFWNDRLSLLKQGVVHAGRLETFFRAFRNHVLPLVHSAGTVASLLTPRSAWARKCFHDEVWDTWRWRAAIRLFFSRPVLGRLGRDPELFRYAKGAVGAALLERSRHALATLPVHENPYLHYIFTGNFGRALPDYLQPQHHAAIRRGLSRLRIVRAGIHDALASCPGTVDAFNLSDVAEYMDVPTYESLMGAVRKAAAPGARVAYWNLFVARSRPVALTDAFQTRVAEAQRLHARAHAFFYRALVLEIAR